MPTATDTPEAVESPTYTVIIGSGLLDQEIAWRYDRALNAYNPEDGSADDWDTWRNSGSSPEERINALVRIMAHCQALLNAHN